MKHVYVYIWNTIFLLNLLIPSAYNQIITMKNRPSSFSGRFYEKNPEALIRDIKNFLAHSNKLSNRPLAIISPHAGYVFSGQTAAHAFAQINPNELFDNIFILAPSHHVLESGAALYLSGNYETPLGEVIVNRELSQALIDKYPHLFHENNNAHELEHSIEVQLPFIQVHFQNKMPIVPILLTTDQYSDCRAIAEALLPYFNNRNLFVISSDLSHYPTYDIALKVDSETIEAIIANDIEKYKTVIKNKNHYDNLYTRACGKYPIAALLYLTQYHGKCQYKLISYTNSGNSPYGDKERVVGYASIAVETVQNDGINFNDTEKKQLLQLARKTIEQYLKDKTIPTIDYENMPILSNPMGAFVSLYKKGELRGCIGTFHNQSPLYKTIQEMAIASATRDYRFEPIKPDELNDITIEISVLTPLKKIDNIHEIILGKHGIYIKKGSYSGTFLPQVYDKTGWTLEEFLGHCARDKAGIGWDGWKDAEIYTYEAIVFSE